MNLDDFMNQYTDQELHQTPMRDVWEAYKEQTNKRLSLRNFTRALKHLSYDTTVRRVNGKGTRVYTRNEQIQKWTNYEEEFLDLVTRFVELRWREIDPLDGEPANRPNCNEVTEKFNEWSGLCVSTNRLTRKLRHMGYYPMSGYTSLPPDYKKHYHRSYKYNPYKVQGNKPLTLRTTPPPEERDRHVRWVREFFSRLDELNIDLDTTPQRDVYEAFEREYSDIRKHRFSRIARELGYYTSSKRINKTTEKIYVRSQESAPSS